jgi:prepilin-type N-terminal cleavage/methylation domain-containing protein
MTKIQKFYKIKKGFTLIELLFYVTIIGVVLVSMTVFLWDIIWGGIKETAYQEVQQNGRFALTKIIQETKKSTGIISPANSGDVSNSLTLSMADGSNTTFSVTENKLRIIQGSPPVSFYLTSDEVKISKLKFTNLSYSNTPGAVRVEMTIDHINPGSRNEYQASVNLNSTIALLPEGGVVPVLPYFAQLHYRWRNDDGGE